MSVLMNEYTLIACAFFGGALWMLLKTTREASLELRRLKAKSIRQAVKAKQPANKVDMKPEEAAGPKRPRHVRTEDGLRLYSYLVEKGHDLETVPSVTVAKRVLDTVIGEEHLLRPPELLGSGEDFYVDVPSLRKLVKNAQQEAALVTLGSK